MLKFVDPGGRTWWCQQLPHIEITLTPVRKWYPNLTGSGLRKR